MHSSDMLIEEMAYIVAYSAEIRGAVLSAGCERWLRRSQRIPSMPISSGVTIPSASEAARDLFMAAMRYYRAAGGDVPGEASRLLVALQRSEAAGRTSALCDAVLYFVHSLAAVQSAEVRNAVRAAQLSLRSLQSTWAEMPAATTGPLCDERWLR